MHCSERGDKRELVRRLLERASTAGTDKAKTTDGYVRFSQGHREEPLAAPPVRRDSLPAPAFESWESLLAWTVDGAQASDGFVVNSEGFVIATCGEGAAGQWDGMGADLCLLFDELERTDQNGGALSAICLKFEKHWLVGVRAQNRLADAAFTIGLIAKEFDPRVPERIVAAIASSLKYMQ